MEGKNGAGTKVETQGENAVTIPDSENGIIHGCITTGIGESTNEWFIDSGATTHMTNNLVFCELMASGPMVPHSFPGLLEDT